MRISNSLPLASLLLVFTLFQSAAADTQIDNYNESFYSREYCDVANTTAWWDTVSGQLKLPFFQIGEIGSASVSGACISVEVIGDFAFVASGIGGLQVVDISDPSNPAVVGTGSTSGSGSDIAVSGDYAFMAADGVELCVFDISDPTNPVLEKQIDGPYNGHGIAVAGDYCFVANAYYGIYVYNITNASNPTLAGQYDTPGNPTGVAVAGHYACVADGSSGLQVIDVSNPAAPSLYGTVDTPGNAFRVAVSGQFAYVADGPSGLQVIDISDPANPSILGSYDTPDDARDVAVDCNRVYAADLTSGIREIDVSDPANPVRTGFCDTPGQAFGVAVAGTHAFVADHASGLRVLEVANEYSPLLPAGSFASAGGPTAVAAYGTHVYVAGDWLDIYDTSDPLAPVKLGGASLPGSPRGIALYGNYVYIATEYGYAVSIFDISDPSTPVYLPYYATGGVCNDVVLEGNHLFVANEGSGDRNGILVLDVGDPPNPTEVGNVVQEYSYPQALDICGDYAYVAGYRSGLIVVDISDVSAPDSVGGLATGSHWGDGKSRAYSVTVEGDYAYVGDCATGLVVVDISIPESPVVAGTAGLSDCPMDMVVSGDRLYLAGYSQGMIVYDISDPTAPVFLSSPASPGWAHGTALVGDMLWVADLSTGIHMMQVCERDVSGDDNLARSLTIPWDEPITDIALQDVRTGSGTVEWEISADGGAHWQAVAVGTDPMLVDFPGTELQWRTALHKNQAGDYPVCHNLFIIPNQLVPVAVSAFEAIAVDGGVELQWNVHADEAIRGYNVYRRVGADGDDVRLTAGGLIAAQERRYLDDSAAPGTEYTYTLGVVKADGSEVLSRSARATTEIRGLALRQNFPNPFNPSTTISFSLPETAPVRLAVYSAAGTLVRVLEDGPVTAGNREYMWDGRNEAGVPVGSGVYFYRLDTGTNTITRKMVLLK